MRLMQSSSSVGTKRNFRQTSFVGNASYFQAPSTSNFLHAAPRNKRRPRLRTYRSSFCTCPQLSTSASKPESKVLYTIPEKSSSKEARTKPCLNHTLPIECQLLSASRILFSISKDSLRVAWCRGPKYREHRRVRPGRTSFSNTNRVYASAFWRIKHGTCSCLSSFWATPILCNAMLSSAFAVCSWHNKSSGS